MTRSDGARADGLTAAQVLAYLDSRSAPDRPSRLRPRVPGGRGGPRFGHRLGPPEPVGPAPEGRAAELLEPDLVRAMGARSPALVMLRPEVRADAIRGLLADGRVKQRWPTTWGSSEDCSRSNSGSTCAARRSRSPARPRSPSLKATPSGRGLAGGRRGGRPRRCRGGGQGRVLPAPRRPSRSLAMRVPRPGGASLTGSAVNRRHRAAVGARTGARAPHRVGGARPAASHRDLRGRRGRESSLVARFMLEHTRLPEEERIPFGYLDFARAAWDVGDPIGLSRELAAPARPPVPRPAAGRRLRVPARLAAGDRAARRGGDRRAGRPGRQRTRRHPRHAEVRAASLRGRPRYVRGGSVPGGEERAYPLWEQLDYLQRRWPFLRVVVAGRAPVESLSLAGARRARSSLATWTRNRRRRSWRRRE